MAKECDFGVSGCAVVCGHECSSDHQLDSKRERVMSHKDGEVKSLTEESETSGDSGSGSGG